MTVKNVVLKTERKKRKS